MFSLKNRIKKIAWDQFGCKGNTPRLKCLTIVFRLKMFKNLNNNVNIATVCELKLFGYEKSFSRSVKVQNYGNTSYIQYTKNVQTKKFFHF